MLDRICPLGRDGCIGLPSRPSVRPAVAEPDDGVEVIPTPQDVAWLTPIKKALPLVDWQGQGQQHYTKIMFQITEQPTLKRTE